MLSRFSLHEFGKAPRARARAFAALFVLSALLLFVQSATLVHNHDGDLQRQFDCDICLKVNATDYAITSSTFTFPTLQFAAPITIPQFSASTSVLPAFLARAPPALS